MKRTAPWTMLFALVFSLAQVVVSQPTAPGDLDRTFGSGGKVVISDCVPLPSRVRFQSDGKIITAASDSINGESYISRHNADGTPDTSFGNELCGTGVLYLNEPVFVNDLAITADGKYLAAGHYGMWQDPHFAVYRFNSNGTPDTSFGVDGRVVWGWEIIPNSIGERIALQPDGKFIAAGRVKGGYMIVRHHANGTPDATFGLNGVFIDYSVYQNHSINEVLLQPDGKIIVSSRNYIFRVNSNGVLDSSFGTNGVVNTGIALGTPSGAGLQTDGKIVVNGRADGNTSVIKRYRPDGTPDIFFGTNGTVTIKDPQGGISRTLAIQNNGKILSAGRRNGSFGISRYNYNGTIDLTFGTNGYVITPFGQPNLHTGVLTLALQPDGKLIASGEVVAYNYVGSGMVRYLNDDSSSPRKARFDFDADGRADVSVFRPSDTVWYLDRSKAGFSARQFGSPPDKITPADYDGDGKTDIAIFRDGTWWWIKSSDDTVAALQFGSPGDIPVPADYAGDGRDELAVYRNGQWWIYDLATGQTSVTNFGLATDRPVPADYDGDGRFDQAVLRDKTEAGGEFTEWWIDRSIAGVTVVRLGMPTDRPVPSDYDGDGRTDPAFYRDGIWHVLGSMEGLVTFQFGLETDTPAPADYDGDAKGDAAVFRNGTWYVLNSTGGINIQNFGLAGDKPLAATYIP